MPETTDRTFSDLEKRVTGELGDLFRSEDLEYDTGLKTISQRYEERRKAAETSGEAQRQLTESQFGTQIEEEEKAGARKLTSAMEAQRGFGQSPRGLSLITEETERRVRNLKKDRDEQLLLGKVAQAERIDNLIAQEETAVTNARTSYINTLFGISGELRAQRSFETPSEQSKRELQTEAQKSIMGLQAKAPDVGITTDDDWNSAIEKYKGSSAYKNDIHKGELEIKSIEADINKKNAEAAKARADATGLQVDTSNPMVASFTRAVQFLTPGATEAQRKDIVRTYQSMMSTGDFDQAQEYVKRVAREMAPAQEQASVTGREEAILALNTIKSGLAAYVEAGGDTGVIKGSLEKIANIIGKTTDPKLANIGNSIRLAIIDYRKAVSGAAFSEPEKKDYEAAFPSIGNVPELNEAKISSLLSTFDRNQGLFYSRMLGSQNYQNLFGGTQQRTLGGFETSTSTPSSATPTAQEGNIWADFLQGIQGNY